MATTQKQPKKATVKKAVEEMKAELLVTQNDLVEAKRSHASRELVNTARITELRRTIARLKTAVRAAQSEEKA
jgi:ribosomal protein L29